MGGKMQPSRPCETVRARESAIGGYARVVWKAYYVGGGRRGQSMFAEWDYVRRGQLPRNAPP